MSDALEAVERACAALDTIDEGPFDTLTIKAGMPALAEELRAARAEIARLKAAMGIPSSILNAPIRNATATEARAALSAPQGGGEGVA